jgi:adenylate cyclase class 2
MLFEVEQKFAVNDLDAARANLLAVGAEELGPIEQADTYYAHPSRDFAKTDEALRIRRVGSEAFVTYKGPKLDAAVKTREELEFPLGVAAERMPELLALLGFRRVAEVKKRRERLNLEFAGRSIEAALDRVEGVGHFVELETLAEADDLAPAQQAINQLAKRLKLTQVVRRSYLGLLLDAGEPTK